jgi:hypothetical protein
MTQNRCTFVIKLEKLSMRQITRTIVKLYCNIWNICSLMPIHNSATQTKTLQLQLVRIKIQYTTTTSVYLLLPSKKSSNAHTGMWYYIHVQTKQNTKLDSKLLNAIYHNNCKPIDCKLTCQSRKRKQTSLFDKMIPRSWSSKRFQLLK